MDGLAKTRLRKVRIIYSILAISELEANMLYLIVTPPKPATPREGKRPVGRPRKYPVQNGANASATKSESVEAQDESEEEEEDSDRSYWLMKAEPESRMEKGVDVKFSIDDLRATTVPEPWNGGLMQLSNWLNAQG